MNWNDVLKKYDLMQGEYTDIQFKSKNTTDND